MNDVGTGYLLWLGCLFQLHGLHRFYNKKYGTGLLWLCTFGLFGVGQFLDLFLMRSLVDEHNIKTRASLGLSPHGVPLAQPAIALTATLPKAPTRGQLMVKLLKAAAARGGKISVTQAVLDTGASFTEVETTFKEMLKSGYVCVDNHPLTGVVIYDFIELSSTPVDPRDTGGA
ncbi:MAG: NINE protein [Aphanothece sp. CMT-3BRIN-NPC111]|jgi:TM2 domain-containing membrane protein YozV|nr:NINE protein [Aphanothece sp. CMT-3BRIN-NPC111]